MVDKRDGLQRVFKAYRSCSVQLALQPKLVRYKLNALERPERYLRALDMSANVRNPLGVGWLPEEGSVCLPMSKNINFVGWVVLGAVAIVGCGAEEPVGGSMAPTNFGVGSPTGQLPGAAPGTVGVSPAAGQLPVAGATAVGQPAVGAPAPAGAVGAPQGTLDGVPAPAGAAGAAGSNMPCAVSAIVEKACGKCHGASPVFGAPMSLASLADFQTDYAPVTTAQFSGQMMKMAELVRIRINAEMGTRPMPQGEALSDVELATLNDWLTMGAPGGEACAPGAAGAPGAVVDTGATAPSGDNIQDECTDASAYEPLVAVGEEVCYDFPVHGASSPTDTSKFPVQLGESYNEFYYEVPWPKGYVATRFGTKYDREEVLHHWLMFANNNALASPGLVSKNVLGTTLGTDSELIAGWAVGGCTTTYPEDVGVALPDSRYIMLQWHHYNSTGAPVSDGTAAQICVVPPGSRPNTAGLTFLGTENISVLPGSEGKAGGVCVNRSGGPVTIIGFNPHMHEIGVRMTSEVKRAAGGDFEMVFDKEFVFDYQTNYILQTPIVLQPGDAIRSTCYYNNTTAGTVGFGQSTKREMCYQFTLSYPYGALNNGVASLIGATNTCW